jgi:hypothetical protein
MAYGIVRTDSVKATKAGNIKSGRYIVTTTETAIDNGCIVKLDSLITGERDLWKCVAPGGVTTSNCYLVASPEIIYDESTKSGQALDKFQNAAGANITLIPLEVGDTFSISDDCITPINDDDDIPAVGSYVAPAATGVKWAEVASIAQNEVFYGKIIAREIYNGSKYLNVVEMISVR